MGTDICITYVRKKIRNFNLHISAPDKNDWVIHKSTKKHSNDSECWKGQKMSVKLLKDNIPTIEIVQYP